MNVRELRQHLVDLGKVLSSAKASASVVGDLESICAGLAPFEKCTLKDFAAFLIQAEGYSRGEVPVKGVAKDAKEKPPKTEIDADALMMEIKLLYDNAASPSTSQEQIDAALGKVSKLKKNAVIAVAEKLDLKVPKSKSSTDIVVMIRQRIFARKGSATRAELIDRPTANGQQPAPKSAAMDPMTSFGSE
jgi:nucleoid DNA-binding protein